MFEVDAAILVGAGIGVTPFVSILRTIIDHIWERRGVNDRRGKPCLPKKVLFFWIGYRPEVEAFRWFLEQLALWEKKFEEIHARPENHDLFLDIQLYLTLRTAKDAAADYNQLKIDTRQGLVSISDLDAKMIRNAELERLQGELTQGRSSKSENNRRGTMVADDSVPPVADPWKSEYSEQVVSSGGSSVGAQTRQRRTPRYAAACILCFCLQSFKFIPICQHGQPGRPSILPPRRGNGKAQSKQRARPHQRSESAHRIRPSELGQNLRRCRGRVCCCCSRSKCCTPHFCCRHNIKNWHVMFCGPRPLKVALEETCRYRLTHCPDLRPLTLPQEEDNDTGGVQFSWRKFLNSIV